MNDKTITFRTFILLVCIALFWFRPSVSIAENKIIAVTETWPPFRITAKGTKHGFTGIDIDLLEMLGKHLNIQIEIQRHPFARALEMINKGEADLISGVAYTKKRAEFISYVPTSYFTVRPVFYAQKGKGSLIQTYNDLYKGKVGYSLHSAYFDPFNSDTEINKLGLSTEEQLIKMLAMGRLDLIIGTNPNLAYDIKRYGFKEKVEQTQYVPEKMTPIYIGLSKMKNHIRLLQETDIFLKQIIENGRFDLILNKYL